MVALWWRGFVTWFQKDDFAWLQLDRIFRNHEQSLWWILFHPLAQGTVRTLSERAVYLVFVHFFGLTPVPFRILQFATCAAAAAMLCAVTVRLTKSRAAGLCAAMLWIANCALGVPMAWAAVYNELAWSLCILVAFWLLIRYVETGEARFFIAQCVVFAIGFLVLELNVVYPAIALAFAILSPEARARKLWIKVLPLFALSVIYTVVHLRIAPLADSGPYKLHWDSRMFQTLLTYWGWALGPGLGRLIDIRSTLARSTGVWLLTIVLAAFVVMKLRRGNWLALFPLVWFVVVLAPLLPLRDHLMQEYVTAPALGLAMWGGWAIANEWRSGWGARIVTMTAISIYAGFSIPIGQRVITSFYARGERIHHFVEQVIEQAKTHPGETVFLRGVTPELDEDALQHRVFHLYGLDDVQVVK